MKRLITALIVLALVISIGLTGLIVNTNTTDMVMEKLEMSKNYAFKGNNKQAKKEIEEAINEWENKMETMLIFVSHGKLDQIEESINIADSYLENNEMPLFYAECRRASTLLEHFENVEYPSVTNIF